MGTKGDENLASGRTKTGSGEPGNHACTVSGTVAEIRRALKRGGSAEHAKGVQWFFKEEIQSHGWYTGPLRRLAAAYRRRFLKEMGIEFLVKVADKLFTGRVLEEKIFAVLLLEGHTRHLQARHFDLFESWLDRISSWADHDGLVHYLIAPMILAQPARIEKIFKWAKSPDHWHRRAACVALIQSTRKGKQFHTIVRLANMLLTDEDDMVQKGLGWLLRETAKGEQKRTLSFLLKIRDRAPRLVLRTACETLPQAAKRKVLGSSKQRSFKYRGFNAAPSASRI
ncbi:MAG: DNA alkylation repair protein [Acidobacteria bacterium]|nr:DNA alkylation repair protein [Acidobacteriota bacterium]